MRNKLHKLFTNLPQNKRNYIIYFENGKRFKKLFCDISEDIDKCISKLTSVSISRTGGTVAIIGPTSYMWMIIDLACMKGGFKSIAIPENFSDSKIKEILSFYKPEVILIDYSIQKKISNNNVHLFNCFEQNVKNDFEKIEFTDNLNYKENLVLEEYSIAFSSGTSENLKHIKLCHNKEKSFSEQNFKEKLKSIKKYIYYLNSFWSRKNNKIIIFMPFSHSQQRSFIRLALLAKINIVLSDPLNCLKHLILEKPNIMVSVPIFYDVLANRISEKLKRLKGIKKALFRLYNKLYINDFRNGNPIKKILNKILFGKIKKIYGGKADYFITGSAPISKETLEIFYSIGVKIYEGYGQSETDIIALNSSKNFKIGSVGKPLVEIKVDDNSEILIKYNEYRHSHNKDILDIDEYGYIHTGDLGYLDKEGFLFLKERKDNVIVLTNGKKIFPSDIESKIKEKNLAIHPVVFNNKSDSLHVVFHQPNKNKIAIETELLDINSELPDYSKLKKYYLVKEPFNIENGLLTSTYKVKRKAVEEKYASAQFTTLS